MSGFNLARAAVCAVLLCTLLAWPAEGLRRLLRAHQWNDRRPLGAGDSGSKGVSGKREDGRRT